MSKDEIIKKLEEENRKWVRTLVYMYNLSRSRTHQQSSRKNAKGRSSITKNNWNIKK